MTKKKKAAPVKKRAKKRAVAAPTKEDIRKMWTGSAKSGLGSGKAFHQDIFDAYFTPLEKKIQENLDSGATFGATEEKNTKQVAKDIGKVCRMLTKDGTVTKDTFDAVFRFMRDHPLCPAPGAGGGGWCDIPTP
jgi:hypothetical protein